MDMTAQTAQTVSMSTTIVINAVFIAAPLLMVLDASILLQRGMSMAAEKISVNGAAVKKAGWDASTAQTVFIRSRTVNPSTGK